MMYIFEFYDDQKEEAKKAAEILRANGIEFSEVKAFAHHCWSKDDVHALCEAADVILSDEDVEEILVQAEDGLTVDCSAGWEKMIEVFKSVVDDKGVDYDQDALDSFSF